MARCSLARSDDAAADAEPELLLPWYAVGALDHAASIRVAAALASDPRLRREYADVKREQAALACAEYHDEPSLRPMVALFAAIDAEAEAPAKVVAFQFGRAARFALTQKSSIAFERLPRRRRPNP